MINPPHPSHRQRWPLFLRIFVLILGTVLLVQLLNFAALLMVPPPTPVVYSTSRIALVARLGRDPAGLLTTSITDRRPEPANDARDLRLGRLIAGELSLPTEAVVVEGHRYGPPVMVGAFRSPLPMGMPRPPTPFAVDNGLFGQFVVSIHEPHDRWRAIRPARSPFGPWQSRVVMWFLVAMQSPHRSLGYFRDASPNR